METFNCSQHMVQQAKHLVKEKGVLSTPKRLDRDTATKVRDFNHSPDVSR